MRELGRDARNLALTPRAELMLYLTREVQLLEEATRPALARADVVIADRYVYTAETLAVHGRGMSPHEVTPVVTAAANGLVPDLVEPGDLVLVKGSRGMRTDKVADRIQEVFKES